MLEERVIGNILRDAWMERKSPNSNVRLRFQQTSPKHDERFFYIFNFYALWCAGSAVLIKRLDKRSDSTRYVLYSRYAFSTGYYDLFYVNGVKTIPNNISEYLTAVSLAFWIMDDGHKNGGLVLNTQGFTLSGNLLLVEALNNNFGFHSYVRYESKLPVIYIPARDMVEVRKLVLRYMLPSTHYKIL